ncbi:MULTISPECIES: ead/Ea22-like family protein [Citrobacter freundii complex]|uniref:ead/Ea22-like family protein n=1 Tax=Citrobacter freundii complex TaxID=1344959 RepID=UPI0016446A4F|nr:ead/Ea22-like family protein [Citrobacter portucalensis]
MTALNKQALREAAENATQGEWWSDVVETDGEYGEGEDRASGYHSYAVYVDSESLLDMTNSTAACIHEEWDHDYHMAWDETAKRNAEFIAAANPATVLALLDELEAAEKRISELEARAFNPAILDVVAERQRQVSAEGWTPAHDDQHRNNDMAFAAACYAFHAAAASWDLEDGGVPYDSHPVPKNWPWEPDWWKPTDPRRDLVKAGALIIAEIERIDRAAGIGVKGE